MADIESKRVWQSMIRVVDALAGLPTQDKLEALELAWLMVASDARTEQLIIPGGFPMERDRQVLQLRKMAEFIESDAPDLEMERLFYEGDIDGMMRRLQRRYDEAEESDQGPTR